MQTQASHRHNQLSRIAGMAIILSCAAIVAAPLTPTPLSIGSANAAPVKLAAIPAETPGAKEAAAAPAAGSGDSPTRPNCADLGRIASTQQAERTGGSTGAVGCGARSNVAGGTRGRNQSKERLDVTTFLAWHVQARNLIQTSLTDQSWTVANEDRPRRR